MKPNDLEQQLQRQPFRPIPPEWRGPILAAARQAGRLPSAARPDRQASWWHAVLAPFDSRPSALLWPSPRAWAALAVVWLGILAAQLAMRDEAPSSPAQQATVSARQFKLARAEQQRLLAKLIEPPEPPTVLPPRPSPPKPHSGARRRIAFA